MRPGNGAAELEARIEALAGERRKQAERLELFDANAWLGEPAGFPLARGMDLPALRAALQKHAIPSALVSHWAGLQVSAQAGNRALEESLRGAGMRAVWTGLPLFPREEGPLPGLPTGQSAAQPAAQPTVPAGGVRLFPRSQNFPLLPWVVGELCAWLAEHRLPLFLWQSEIDWLSLHALAVAFPRLAIVVETGGRQARSQSRVLFALMRDCPNLFAETSQLLGADALRFAARELGARRLLFGSFLPVNDPWAGIGMILEAELPWEEKRLVAGDNLRRLLAEAPL